jgi:hypothetical protein
MLLRFVFLIGLGLVCAPLTLRARAPLAGKLGSCKEAFQIIAQKAKSSLNLGTSSQALPDKEVQAYLATLDNSKEGVRRQARDLVDLRMEIERKKELQDPEKNLKFRALNWKNEYLGLIPGDIHGQEFIKLSEKYWEMSNRLKKTFIRRYAGSRNPDFAKTWLDLIDQETEPDLQHLLREVASARQVKLNYTAPALRQQIFSQLKDASAPAKVLGNELGLLPDKMLAELLADNKNGTALRAADGLAGRSQRFLKPVILYHPRPELRAIALQRLPESSSPSYLEILLDASTDKSEKVRQLAVASLQRQVGNGKADKRLLVLTQDKDQKTASMAMVALKQRYDEKALAEGRLVPVPRGAFQEYTDRQVVETILGSDQELAMRATSVIQRLPLSLRYEALRSSDPEVRLEVLKGIRSTDGRYTPELNSILLKDPVADIRLEGVRGLESQASGPQTKNILFYVAENDADERVRLEARAILHNEKSGPARLRVNESFEITYKKYLADAVKEFGAEGVREQDVMPLIAAQHVYLAPEADTAATAAELVANHQKFLHSTPPGYRVDTITTDPLSGLKAVVYKSADANERPTIVSIAGTETRSDRIVDANLGLMQARSPAFQRLVNYVANSARAAPDGSWPKIVITGHSLGGGLAQIFGHNLTVALKARGQLEAAQNLRIVTWNSLGGLKPLKRLGNFDPEVAKNIAALNYYAPGDVVSLIGTHLGETVQVNGLKMRDPRKVHGIDVLKDAFFSNGGPETSEAKKRILSLRLLPEVSRVTGFLTDSLQYFRYKTKERETFMKLAKARLEWAGEEDYKVIKPEYDWLKDELVIAANRMFGEKNREKARKYLEWIEKQRLKIVEKRRAEASNPPAMNSPDS